MANVGHHVSGLGTRASYTFTDILDVGEYTYTVHWAGDDRIGAGQPRCHGLRTDRVTSGAARPCRWAAPARYGVETQYSNGQWR